MRTPLRRSAVLACALALSVTAAVMSSAAAAGTQPSGVSVQLLSITDFHGQLEPTDDTVTDAHGKKITVGGAAYLAAHIKRLRSGHPNSIFFATGDNFSGWPKAVWSAQDEPTIEVMNQLGLEFSAVGNHELDVSRSFLIDHMVHGECFGRIGLDSCFVDSTGSRFHGADFDYLTGNVVTTRGHRHILPGTIVKRVDIPGSREQLRVGFINLTIPSTRDPIDLSRSFHPSLDSLPIVETANAAAARLRDRGVRAIVLNVHQGAGTTGGFDTCTDVTGPMMDANDRLSPDIDAIVTGHWHNAFTCMVDDPAGHPRPLVEAGNAGRLVNEIDLKLDPGTGEVLRDQTVSTNHPVTHDVAPDPAMQQLVDYWVGEKVHTRGISVADIAEDVTGVRTATGESALGDLIADAYQATADRDRRHRSDLALMVTESGPKYGDDLTVAPGHEEGDIPGVIAAGDSWNAVEYASNIITVTMSGSALDQVFEQQWRRTEDGAVTFVPLAVSGNVHYSYDLSRPVGHRVDLGDISINGEPLRPGRRYRVTAPILTAHGQDGFTAFKDAIRPVRHPRMRVAFRRYLAALATVRPPATDRVDRTGQNPVEVSGTAQLSDLDWRLGFSGWRTVARDTEVGGHPLKLAGKTYAKGLGLGSPGEVMYDLGERCSRLTARVGVDDYVQDSDGATASFQVFADERLVFDSGVLRPGKVVDLDVPLAGVSTLQLRVTGGGDGWYGDRGDWVNPRLRCH